MIGFVKLISNMKFEFLGKKADGDNIVCKITSPNYIPSEHKIESENNEEDENVKNTIKEVYLTAHYDTVTSSMPIFSKIRLVGMGLSLLTILLLSITTGILNLITHYASTSELLKTSTIMSWIVLGASAFVTILTIIGFFSKRTNDSSGACDNGSGSAVLLELASFFGKNPLDNVNLTFIWCTAEEWGLYGSKAYVKAHKEELLNIKDRFFNINVDMVGEEIAYVEKKGIFRKNPINKTLNNLIKESAEEKEIEIRGFKAMIAGSSDHAPFAKIKLEVATFNSKKDVKRIHSKKDCIDIVKPENMTGAVEVIKSVIQKLNKKEN
jgi:hypothetical protein